MQEALTQLKSVKSAEVDLATKTAVIDSAVDVQDADIKSSIEGVGYDVVSIVAG